MGREAECICERGSEAAQVKAILESRELILRGGMSRRFSFTQMAQVKATRERLCFRFKEEAWSLEIGAELAAKWAAIIIAPPPSLAKKMGITANLSVEMAGEIDDKALEDALSEAKAITRRGGDLIVARVETAEALARVLQAKAEPLANGVPLWVVFRKGRGPERSEPALSEPVLTEPALTEPALTEHDVRRLCLAAGLVDHKVTAVSGALTALRFVKRRT
jgi:hypothetical protein